MSDEIDAYQCKLICKMLMEKDPVKQTELKLNYLFTRGSFSEEELPIKGEVYSKSWEKEHLNLYKYTVLKTKNGHGLSLVYVKTPEWEPIAGELEVLVATSYDTPYQYIDMVEGYVYDCRKKTLKYIDLRELERWLFKTKILSKEVDFEKVQSKFNEWLGKEG